MSKNYSKKLGGQRDIKFTIQVLITIFNPHPDDADTSNNASIVARLTQGGFLVMITGDCEQPGWDSIVRYFSKERKSDVLVAQHHAPNSIIAVR